MNFYILLILILIYHLRTKFLLHLFVIKEESEETISHIYSVFTVSSCKLLYVNSKNYICS
jgi:hypothetical protein